jgi:hypothetical protein
MYNISAIGDQSTSQANLLTQKNELPHLFCTWEEEKSGEFVIGGGAFSGA